ncbi:MAG TPA: hypothetical protein VFG42_22235 [Baekduia sp.]|uniref:hypothetical protein n=1 Tax=Baekduia sp. TaxID=2600305 RepID=UPI002D798675|nr:hypothetical protein [Baekduia sp.]HET6509534.1 hypothetical protein [Baekduia sp.]
MSIRNALAGAALVAADPNAYDWGGYGRLIDAAHARGWKVMVTFRVRWTASDGATYVGPPVGVYG